jgi:membrane protein DedA with SNARE-associated domain
MLVIGAGYYFGMTLEALFDDIRRTEELILLAVLIAGFLVWMWRLICTILPRLRASQLR